MKKINKSGGFDPPARPAVREPPRFIYFLNFFLFFIDFKWFFMGFPGGPLGKPAPD